MQIGITERGDAGLDLSWFNKLSIVDGAILITKKLTDEFCRLALRTPVPVIVHCTCTGWGGSWLEPNVPDYRLQLYKLLQLLECGFPRENIVLRVDPIVPNDEGLARFDNVLGAVMELQIPVERIRVSIYDEYPHVRSRLIKNDHRPFYTNNAFQASPYDTSVVAGTLSTYPFIFETCAEQISAPNVVQVGCVSQKDLNIMGLSTNEQLYVNPQNRKGCLCLSCKKELLTHKGRCPNGCLYCYWR